MNKYETTISKCGGKRGCTLDEYYIPKGIYDKYICFHPIEIFRNDISIGYDIQKVLSVPSVKMDKMEKKEKQMEKEIS